MYNVVDDTLSPDVKFWQQALSAVFPCYYACPLTVNILIINITCRYVYKNLKKKSTEYGSVNDQSIKVNYLRIYHRVQYAMTVHCDDHGNGSELSTA